MESVKRYTSFFVQCCDGLAEKYLVCIAFGDKVMKLGNDAMQFDHYVYGRGDTVELAMTEAWRKFEEYPHGKTDSRQAA